MAFQAYRNLKYPWTIKNKVSTSSTNVSLLCADLSLGLAVCVCAIYGWLHASHKKCNNFWISFDKLYEAMDYAWLFDESSGLRWKIANRVLHLKKTREEEINGVPVKICCNFPKKKDIKNNERVERNIAIFLLATHVANNRLPKFIVYLIRTPTPKHFHLMSYSHHQPHTLITLSLCSCVTIFFSIWSAHFFQLNSLFFPPKKRTSQIGNAL